MVLLFYIDVECRVQGAIFYTYFWLQKPLKTEPFFYFLKEIYREKTILFIYFFIFSAVSKAWAT